MPGKFISDDFIAGLIAATAGLALLTVILCVRARAARPPRKIHPRPESRSEPK